MGAKKIDGYIKLNIPAGAANPSPPVVITVFVDKSFTFVTKTPPVSYFIKKAAGKDKASSEPGRSFVGKVNSKQVREIAENKMKDLNAADIEGAVRMVEGSARSMGI